jgi:glyoxylate reductase
VIDQPALIEALHAGTIAGAALDVTDPEPLPADHPLLRAPNALVIPHVGSATTRTRARMTELAVDNVLAGLAGEPLPHPAPAPSPTHDAP